MVARTVAFRLGLALTALFLVLVVGAGLWPSAPNPELLTYMRPIHNEGASGLYALDPARNLDAPLVVLAGDQYRIADYAWSPDGRWFAYAIMHHFEAGGWVTLHGPDGASRAFSLEGVDRSTDVIWYPDDLRLMVIHADNRILTLDLTTDEFSEVFVFDLQFIQKNTSMILNPREMVVRGQGVQARHPSYFTISLASGAARAAEDVPCPDDSPRAMTLSPDGAQIIYGCFDTQMLIVAPIDDLDNGQPFAPLSELGRLGIEGSPRWSPDGDRVLFNHYPMFTQPNEPPYMIYMANLTTGALKTVTPPRVYEELGWLPSGALRRGR